MRQEDEGGRRMREEDEEGGWGRRMREEDEGGGWGRWMREVDDGGGGGGRRRREGGRNEGTREVSDHRCHTRFVREEQWEKRHERRGARGEEREDSVCGF
jgi:hypothetical protein